MSTNNFFTHIGKLVWKHWTIKPQDAKVTLNNRMEDAVLQAGGKGYGAHDKVVDAIKSVAQSHCLETTLEVRNEMYSQHELECAFDSLLEQLFVKFVNSGGTYAIPFQLLGEARANIQWYWEHQMGCRP